MPFPLLRRAHVFPNPTSSPRDYPLPPIPPSQTTTCPRCQGYTGLGGADVLHRDRRREANVTPLARCPDPFSGTWQLPGATLRRDDLISHTAQRVYFLTYRSFKCPRMYTTPHIHDALRRVSRNPNSLGIDFTYCQASKLWSPLILMFLS